MSNYSTGTFYLGRIISPIDLESYIQSLVRFESNEISQSEVVELSESQLPLLDKSLRSSVSVNQILSTCESILGTSLTKSRTAISSLTSWDLSVATEPLSYDEGISIVDMYDTYRRTHEFIRTTMYVGCTDKFTAVTPKVGQNN